MKKTVRYIGLTGLLCIGTVFSLNADNTSFSALSPGKSGTGTNEFEELLAADKQDMYLLKDTNIISDNTNTASVIDTQRAGTTVSVITIDGSMCRVLTENGRVGYIPLTRLTAKLEYVFTPQDEIKYAKEGTVLLGIPFDNGTEIEELEENDEIHVIGTNDLQYWEVEADGRICYVSKDDLMDEKKIIIVTPPPVPQRNDAGGGYTPNWDGTVLNPRNGAIIGPSGKETYYNLPMQGVINIMRAAGFNYEYWVRSDGVKMYGDYVMIAADLSIRPRGSLVPTSLGMGIVCDTGTFIYTNPTQIDIAVAW
ncbi:MAG: hypothetical protein IKG46_04545 [Solobacterium sp.]|nr:hypothetical protein [Solobacterium sp.]